MTLTPWAPSTPTALVAGRGLPGVALGFVAVFVLAVLSVHFAPPDSDVATWWPAAGVGSAMVVLSPPRHWPALLAGILVVTAVANAFEGRSPGIAALFGLANAAESLVLALVLGAGRSPRSPLVPMRGPEDLPRVLVAIVAGAMTAGTLVACTVTVALEGSFAVTWTNVTAAHGAATLLILPLVLMLGDPQARLSDDPRVLQVVQVVATLGAFALVHHSGQSLPLAFLPLPLLVWGAQVLSPRALALEALAAGLIVTALATSGGGPFGSDADISARVRDALVQLDLVVIALVSLPLALNVSQRRAALREAVAVGETYRRSMTESVIGTLLLRPTDGGLQVLDLNEPAGDLLGVRRAALLERDWAEVLGPHGGLVVDAALEMTAGRRSGWEHELWLATEPPRCVRLALSWVPDTSSGDLVVAQLVDLTEQRVAQRSLEKELRFNAALLDATTGTSIIATDRDGLATYVNRGTRRLLGYAPSDLVGRRHLVDLYDADELRERAAETEHGAPVAGDWTLVGADGRRLRVNVNVTPLRDAGGELLGYLQVSEDVTERALAQETLRAALEKERRAVEELERLDRSKSDFLATVSHELRTPMTSIMGFNEILASEVVGPVNDRQREVLRRGSRAGQRLLGLIENILTMSRAESLAQSAHHQPLDLGALLVRVVEGTEPLAEAGLTADLSLPSGDPVRVLGDAAQLERALVNVVSNALKFTPGDGEVRIRMETDGGGQEGAAGDAGWAVVTVEDTGIGIPLEEQGRLFERFFRASSAVHASIPGTGLGLAIVRTIVQAHAGTVTVVSQPGDGTTVRISLPRLPAR
ncbi:ATP-binding protein [Nocardioides lijunqiniae]|uniref:ATP-binding protein n=1 Tax=Nocardioides lijunqiniae TaxID=2760832 RepID=UPI0018785AD0